jgi:hypothetical protein
LAGGSNALDSDVEVMQRTRVIARRVLDGEPGDPRSGSERHIRVDLVRCDRKATLEIGVHRNTHGVRHNSHVLEGLIQGDVIVRPPEGPGEAGARRCKRGKAHLLKGTRRPGVPRVWHHEAT